MRRAEASPAYSFVVPRQLVCRRHALQCVEQRRALPIVVLCRVGLCVGGMLYKA